ncbi:MAG TPA: hypothetical protein VG325_15880 [Solirubrobacteraceae bacterium]|nr:hypothetical protein [Solirubrobacteraceae bacterium]
MSPIRRQDHGHGLVRAGATVATVALLQAPARIATYVLLLRRLRETNPELFDGAACRKSIAACLDEYERELPG